MCEDAADRAAHSPGLWTPPPPPAGARHARAMASLYPGAHHAPVPTAPAALDLTPAVLAEYKPARVFKASEKRRATESERDRVALTAFPPRLQTDPVTRINSLSFHRVHQLLFTASDDGVIRAYDTEAGAAVGETPCPRTGAAHVAATHAPTAVLHACTKAANDSTSESVRVVEGGRGREGSDGGGARRAHLSSLPPLPPSSKPRTPSATWTCTPTPTFAT